MREGFKTDQRLLGSIGAQPCSQQKIALAAMDPGRGVPKPLGYSSGIWVLLLGSFRGMLSEGVLMLFVRGSCSWGNPNSSVRYCPYWWILKFPLLAMLPLSGLEMTKTHENGLLEYIMFVINCIPVIPLSWVKRCHHSTKIDPAGWKTTFLKKRMMIRRVYVYVNRGDAINSIRIQGEYHPNHSSMCLRLHCAVVMW